MSPQSIQLKSKKYTLLKKGIVSGGKTIERWKEKKAKSQARHQQSRASSLVKLQEFFTKIRNTVQETCVEEKVII